MSAFSISPLGANRQNAPSTANRQNASRATNAQDTSCAADAENAPGAIDAENAQEAAETQDAADAGDALVGSDGPPAAWSSALSRVSFAREHDDAAPFTATSMIEKRPGHSGFSRNTSQTILARGYCSDREM